MGLRFNPLASIVGASVSAAVSGRPRASRTHVQWSLALVAIAWLLGDGWRVVVHLRGALGGEVELLGRGAPLSVAMALLVSWALTGIFFGYLLPGHMGAYTGRHVVRGTGWLAAIAVASAAASGLVAISARLAALVQAVAS